jgi:WD40 repeat protein
MEGKVRIWDVDSGGELREIRAVGKVWTVRFSPDGKLIASGGPDCILQLWDAESGKEVRRMIGHTGGVSEVAFSPDGKTVASAGHDQTVRLWDVETGTLRFPFAGHSGAVPAIAISPREGRIATGGSDGVVILWDRDTAKEVSRFACLETCLTALAYSPDGRLLAAAACRTGRQSRDVIQRDGVVILDAASGKVIRHFESIRERTFGLAFGRDGRKLSAFCHDGVLHTWNIESGEELEQLALAQPRRNVVAAFSSDGEKLALADEGSVRLFDRWTGKERHSLNASDLGDAPTAMAFSPDSRTLAAAGADRNVYVWELLTGRQRATIASRGSFASALTFRPRGWTLAVADIGVLAEGWRALYSEAGSDTTIHIHDLAGAQAEWKLSGHRGTINALLFGRDGRFLFSGSNDCTAVMWDMEKITKEVSNNKELNKDQLERHWRDLGSQDAGQAFQAMWRLASAKNAVAFLADHIKPAGRQNDPTRYTRLINQLDAESFDARESAADELEHLGEAAAPALREALQGKPSAGTRSKIEDILSRIDRPVTAADRLSALRGVEILEHIADAEARQALEKLAHGAPNERLTEDAKRSLERLTSSPK